MMLHPQEVLADNVETMVTEWTEIDSTLSSMQCSWNIWLHKRQ